MLGWGNREKAESAPGLYWLSLSVTDWGNIVLFNFIDKADISQCHHWLPVKWRLRNKFRNCILMTRHYPDLSSASDWPCPHGKFASANQKLYPDLQGGISALLSQRSFCGETSSGIANVGCFLRLVTRFRIHLHIHIIVNLPPFYFPILSVCRMFETWTWAATGLL